MSDESVVKAFEQQQVVGKLRLSQAIRIGASMSGPAVNYFVTADGRTCAQGAALLAVGRLVPGELGCDVNHRTLDELWPEAMGVRIRISRMNNRKTHTREQITDWLESQSL